MTPWDGFGPISHSIEVPKGSTTYSVYWFAIRDPNNPAPFGGGVRVIVADKELANIECDPTKPIQSRIDEVKLQVRK